MQGYSKIAVAGVAGFLVGMLVNAPLRGEGAQNANPLEGRLSHISFAVADVEKTAGAFADVFGVEMPEAQDFRDIPWGPPIPWEAHEHATHRPEHQRRQLRIPPTARGRESVAGLHRP